MDDNWAREPLTKQFGDEGNFSAETNIIYFAER